MTWILSNPFYCGYITSSMIPGEMIKGHHPAIIDVETFLLVNEIKQQNAITGIPKNLEHEELPLKVFMRDAASKSPFTGYLNKPKKLYYYKTRDKSTKVNISARKLHQQYLEVLGKFEYNKKYKFKLEELLKEKLQAQVITNPADEQQSKKRISELKNQLDQIEERFVLGEITKEQYNKFSQKYNENIKELQQELSQNKNLSSNLEKAIEKGLSIAENISQLWVSAKYFEKQKLQYLVFPEGMQYDKKKQYSSNQKS